MNEQNQWYVTIEGNAVGPVSTDLVVRGIKHKKIATNAHVCVVGATEWQLLADVEEFSTAMREGGLLESGSHNGHHYEPQQDFNPSARAVDDTQSNQSDPDESETTASFPSQRPQGLAEMAPGDFRTDAEPAAHFHETSEADEAPASPSTESPTHAQPTNGKAVDTLVSAQLPHNGHHVELAHEARPMLASIDLDIDVTVDEHVDWNRGFTAYFLVDSEVTLPDEHALLHSLDAEPHDTFLHDEAMWNLALCLAFGPDTVADKAAAVFFDVLTTNGLYERIEWMCRTLLSKGFMPSGIPHAAGYRGLGYLQRVCPPGLLPKLESEAAS